MKEIPYSPFADYSVANFRQFQKNPMILFGKLEMIKDLILQQTGQIKKGYFIGDRSIILGVRGLGKTTALFFVKELLEANDVQVVALSRLVESSQHFERLMGKSIKDYIGEGPGKKPLYLLVDFPDDVKPSQFRKFLSFMWDLISDEEIYDCINLIFAMNQSHYDKSFAYSEILGKFLTVRLEHYDFDKTEQLLSSRLKLIDWSIEELFDTPTIELIHSYSKGIPRNILSAANLLLGHSKDYPIKESFTRDILNQKFIDRLIKDRVSNEELRKKYMDIVNVMRDEFGGTVNSQELFLKSLSNAQISSRVTALKHISRLIDIGVIRSERGGYNQIQRTLTLC